jgi:hypothetical protein
VPIAATLPAAFLIAQLIWKVSLMEWQTRFPKAALVEQLCDQLRLVISGSPSR